MYSKAPAFITPQDKKSQLLPDTLRAVKEKPALATHALFCPCQVYETKKQKSVLKLFLSINLHLWESTSSHWSRHRSQEITCCVRLKKGAAGGNCHLLITHQWENRSSCFPVHLHYFIILYYRLRVEGFFLKSCHRTSHTLLLWGLPAT